jgi:hypothetical protein
MMAPLVEPVATAALAEARRTRRAGGWASFRTGSPEPVTGQSTRVRFTVDPEHTARWQQAAARAGCDFNNWVVQTLDAAAGGVIDDESTS